MDGIEMKRLWKWGIRIVDGEAESRQGWKEDRPKRQTESQRKKR